MVYKLVVMVYNCDCVTVVVLAIIVVEIDKLNNSYLQLFKNDNTHCFEVFLFLWVLVSISISIRISIRISIDFISQKEEQYIVDCLRKEVLRFTLTPSNGLHYGKSYGINLNRANGTIRNIHNNNIPSFLRFVTQRLKENRKEKRHQTESQLQQTQTNSFSQSK
eukprot:Pgem_evm1s17261